jgi:hypothetical protein
LASLKVSRGPLKNVVCWEKQRKKAKQNETDIQNFFIDLSLAMDG